MRHGKLRSLSFQLFLSNRCPAGSNFLSFEQLSSLLAGASKTTVGELLFPTRVVHVSDYTQSGVITRAVRVVRNDQRLGYMGGRDYVSCR
jgi:hypothetical protein